MSTCINFPFSGGARLQDPLQQSQHTRHLPPAAKPAHRSPRSPESHQGTRDSLFQLLHAPSEWGSGSLLASSHSCTVSFTKHLSLHFGLSSLGGKCHGNNWISKKCTCKTIKDCEGCLPLILPSTGQINFTFRRRRSK